MITRYFDLMLFKSGTAPCINVNQYDQGETWIFTLYGQGGTKYTPSTGAIVALKSDGHLIANAGTVDGQGRVVITETEQMTASAGKAVCELQIDGDTHGTANFYLLVEPSPADGGIASESDLSLFQQTVDAVSTIETLLDGEDPNQVIETAVDDWLDAHPEATTTVQDGAITIPKLNDSVLDLLIAESASGNPVVISDGAKNVPVKSLVAEIVPIQSGSGDPAPDNVRPITGHTDVTVTRTDENLDNAQTITTSLGSTVYGGTLDLTTGVLTTTHALFNVTSLTVDNTKTGFVRANSNLPSNAKLSNTNEYGAVANEMKFDYQGIMGFKYYASVPFSFYIAESKLYVVLPTSAATDTESANTWLASNPLTVCYPLKTPTTTQLTAEEITTLLGNNVISASSGSVSVIYRADTKMYVDKMTAVDNAIIAPTEATFTATRNYTVNDLVIVNDTLYKVTSNIASGSTITPNSNVTATTLSALIKALS